VLVALPDRIEAVNLAEVVDVSSSEAARVLSLEIGSILRFI